MRLIDADALIEKTKDPYKYSDYEYAMYADGFIEDINDAPTVNEWIPCNEMPTIIQYKTFSEKENDVLALLDIINFLEKLQLSNHNLDNTVFSSAIESLLLIRSLIEAEQLKKAT